MHPNSRRYFNAIKRQYAATDKQVSYLRKLYGKLSFNLFSPGVGYDIRKALHAFETGQRSKAEASKTIEELKKLVQEAENQKAKFYAEQRAALQKAGA